MRTRMLISQTNPDFEYTWSSNLRECYMLKNRKIDNLKEKLVTGFDDFLNVLSRHTTAFAKPVVYFPEDTHSFRIDKPLVRSADGR